jgi:hypothetical protein
MALRRGRRAVGLGSETLGLARIHEPAITPLKLSDSRHGQIQRAEIFLNEAINSEGPENEIACTQRLVVRSARSVRRVARELRHA